MNDGELDNLFKKLQENCPHEKPCLYGNIGSYCLTFLKHENCFNYIDDICDVCKCYLIDNHRDYKLFIAKKIEESLGVKSGLFL